MGDPTRMILAAALAAWALMAGCAGPHAPDDVPPAPRPESPWIPLFNGKNMDGFYTYMQRSGKNVDPQGYYKVENGMIHLMDIPPTTAVQETGFFATEKSYGNCRLRIEYKWGPKRFAPFANTHDSGILYFVTGPDKVYPSSLEFQVADGLVGDLWQLNNAYRMQTTVKSIADRQKVYLPADAGGVPWTFASGFLQRSATAELPSDWNTLEVIMEDNNATQLVNGQTVLRISGLVTRSDGTPVTEGRIGMQCQGSEMFIRTIAIQPLTP
jgi:hypothetical protein